MIRTFWLWAGWFGVAFTLVVSLLPSVLNDSGGHTDKLVHLVGYAMLMFWWAQLVTQRRGKLAIALVLLGITIELLQGLTPDRQADVFDALANTSGILLGWLVARLLHNLPDWIATPHPLRR